jgi:hypothetical protein
VTLVPNVSKYAEGSCLVSFERMRFSADLWFAIFLVFPVVPVMTQPDM